MKLYEQYLNEAKKLSKGVQAFADELNNGGTEATIHTAIIDDGFYAHSTSKTWPDGSPVTKYFHRDGSDYVEPKPGKYDMIETEDWYYIRLDYEWLAVDRDEYDSTPPFQY